MTTKKRRIQKRKQHGNIKRKKRKKEKRPSVCGKSDRARAGRAQDLFFYISFLKLLMPLKNVYVCACVVYFFPPEREKKGGLTSPLPNNFDGAYSGTIKPRKCNESLEGGG
jgi:hypothetical protein